MSTELKTGVLAILQARASSSRLPGKVLKPLLGKPMMQRQIERLLVCKHINLLVVATSTESSDDPIATVCRSIGVPCFRGALDDVLGRFFGAANFYGGEHILRLTADCPLADPEIIDALVTLYLCGDFDYASNTIRRTYPKGIDAEIFRYDVLAAAHHEATSLYDREHVTPFILKNPRRYNLGCLENDQDLSAYRWTVDWPEDYEFICQVYGSLFHENPNFRVKDVIQLQNYRPDLAKILAPVMNRSS